MTEGRDVQYFFYAYTVAFLLFLGYGIYLATKITQLHTRVQGLELKRKAENGKKM
ncbi:MAG: hypothetical protein V2G42_00410 [bacterium JZ-2024 1]